VYTPKLILHPNVEITRERALPIKGEVHAQVGTEVEATQLVLSTELKGDLNIVRLNERLGISPDDASKGITVSIGDDIEIGTTLCVKKGIFGYFQETVESPSKGKIEFISIESAHIGIRSAPDYLEVKAFTPGTVVKTEHDRLLTIRSRVGIIQGVFGRGAEGIGKIISINIPEDTYITLSDLTSLEKTDLEGGIIAGGMSITEEAFLFAKENSVVGIVTGSLTSSFVEQILGGLTSKNTDERHPIILVTEGFGDLNLSQKASGILKKNHGKMASISGKTQIRAGAIRPELILHEADPQTPLIREETTSIPEVGNQVRIVRGTHLGQIGTISDIPKDLGKLDSGVVARVVEITLENNSKEIIALANLESI
jgi:hypothetical protein